MSRLITMGAVLMLAACPLGTAHSQTQTSTVPNVRSMEVLYQLDDRSGSRPDGQLRELLAFHEGSGIGGGIYRWDKNIDKRNHNGGTVIDPSQDYQQNIDNVSVVRQLSSIIVINSNNVSINRNSVGNNEVGGPQDWESAL